MNQQINKDEAKDKILIVDDNTENIKVLGNILRGRGLKVSIANSGQNALKSIDYKPPDLILLDISMPNMDGFEVCEKLKAQPKTKDIPIIFLTARTQTEDIIKGFELGAVDYITKPFSPVELISRVQTHLELKKSKDIIDKQNKELKELIATKDKFFSIIGHDLKSPFTVVLGYSDLLLSTLEEMDLSEIKQNIKDISEAGKKAYKLLENILQWANIQTGKIKLNKKNIDLFSLAYDVFNLVQPQASKKNITINFEIEENLYCLVDENMVNTIIRNLLSNAIKFTPRGGQVDLKSRIEENKIYISVSDTGIGMSQRQIDELYRIDISHHTKGTEGEQGTGLGLILCKEFVEKHDGELFIESEKDKGTTFSFSLKKSE